MKRKPQTEQTYSVDALMLNTAKTLVRDFRDNLGDPTIYSDFLAKVQQGVVGEVRKVEIPYGQCEDAYTFKCGYQLQNLLKRYRFEQDLYSEDELLERTQTAFLENQARLATFDLKAVPNVYKHILMVARGHATQILGDYRLDEHVQRSRFGKKATVGIPMRKACEAERWVIPLTGSKAQTTWFTQNILGTDEAACNYVLRQTDGGEKPIYQEVEHLTLTLVSKTFKSLRGIMPNTTVGSFYSSGLGDMIAARLKGIGLDITRLQKRHGKLAKLASITGKLVTCDQSSASDNISVALCEAVLPSPWFRKLNLGRIGRFRLPNGEEVLSQTFCTMGIGFTFPLQTLIFLCLLRALDDIYGKPNKKALISVYGDDLIYDDHLHPFVERVFPVFGLVINRDKTFSEGGFRESCGSDYFHGVDVRPFSPQGGSGSHVRRKVYEQTLYKTINGLLRRWSCDEVRWTLQFLVAELDLVGRGILRVPNDYPDEAGVQCISVSEHDDWLPPVLCAPVKVSSNGRFSFRYLRFVSNLKEEHRHEPYLWQALQGKYDDSTTHRHYDPTRAVNSSRTVQIIERVTAVDRDTPAAILWRQGPSTDDSFRKGSRYKRDKRNRGQFVKSSSGRRLRKVTPFIPERGSGVILSQTGVTCFWTP